MPFASRHFRSALLLFPLTLLTIIAARAQEKPLLGFTTEGAAQERALEAKFDAALKAEDLRAWLKQLSAKPHHVGSAAGLANAEFMTAQFKRWGFDTEIERFYVLFPTPKTRLLEKNGAHSFKAKLEEPVLKEDSTSRRTR